MYFYCMTTNVSTATISITTNATFVTITVMTTICASTTLT